MRPSTQRRLVKVRISSLKSAYAAGWGKLTNEYSPQGHESEKAQVCCLLKGEKHGEDVIGETL